MAQSSCGRNCAAMCSDHADMLTQRDLIEFKRTPDADYKKERQTAAGSVGTTSIAKSTNNNHQNDFKRV